MKNTRVLYSDLYKKAKFALLPLLLVVTLISCQKEDLDSPPEITSNATAGNPNLIFEETFEGTTYFPESGTTLNKTHGIENCNNNSTTTPATYDWTLSRLPGSVPQDGRAG